MIVEEIMITDLITLTPANQVKEVLDTKDRKILHISNVDKSNKLAGHITSNTVKNKFPTIKVLSNISVYIDKIANILKYVPYTELTGVSLPGNTQ